MPPFHFPYRVLFPPFFVRTPFLALGGGFFRAEALACRSCFLIFLKEAILPGLFLSAASHWKTRIYLVSSVVGNREPRTPTGEKGPKSATLKKIVDFVLSGKRLSIAGIVT